MKNNFHKLIFSSAVLLIGILGSLLIKYFPTNVLGLILLVFLGIFRFGGLLLFFNYLVKFFAKEKLPTTFEEEQIINRNKSLMYAFTFFAFGILFCFSSFFLPYLCNSHDSICSVTSVGIELLFFVPLGVVLIIFSLSKLYRFFKKVNVES